MSQLDGPAAPLESAMVAMYIYKSAMSLPFYSILARVQEKKIFFGVGGINATRLTQNPNGCPLLEKSQRLVATSSGQQHLHKNDLQTC